MMHNCKNIDSWQDNTSNTRRLCDSKRLATHFSSSAPHFLRHL